MTRIKRDIDGVLLVDKPEGISSAGLVSKVKWALNAKKAGHAGTLDPFATGLMVICLGKATKLSGYFLNDNKRYIAEVELGKETDTQDLTGNVISSRDSFNIPLETIEKTIAEFVGDQKQIPPVYSALKHNGVPLYKLARKGKAVEKPPRDITVFSINILSYESPFLVLDIHCSKGTYIRTLCTDIGRKLGCFGHLKNLRRTFSSGFSLEDSVVLDNISEDKLIDMAECLMDFPIVTVNENLGKKILNGIKLKDNDIPLENVEKPIRVILRDKLIAIIEKNPKDEGYLYNCVFHY